MELDLNEIIGRTVLYFNYQRVNPLRARPAIITGHGVEPKTVNLHVFADHQQDFVLGGRSEAFEMMPNVPMWAGPPEKCGAWQEGCCFTEIPGAARALPKPPQLKPEPPAPGARAGQTAAPQNTPANVRRK